MAKNGFDISEDLKRLEAHQRGIKRAAVAVAKGAALDALASAIREAPEASGALKESGYVINREANGAKQSGYKEHAGEAARLIAESGSEARIEDELPVPSTGAPTDAKAWAAVHIPVNYADDIINGFHIAKSGADVPPNDFFNPAVDAVNATYEQRAQRALDAEMKKLR